MKDAGIPTVLVVHMINDHDLGGGGRVGQPPIHHPIR